jgi:hypothetical protein
VDELWTKHTSNLYTSPEALESQMGHPYQFLAQSLPISRPILTNFSPNPTNFSPSRVIHYKYQWFTRRLKWNPKYRIIYPPRQGRALYTGTINDRDRYGVACITPIPWQPSRLPSTPGPAKLLAGKPRPRCWTNCSNPSIREGRKRLLRRPLESAQYAAGAYQKPRLSQLSY